MLKIYAYMRRCCLYLFYLTLLGLPFYPLTVTAGHSRTDRVDRIIVKYKQPSDQNGQVSPQRASLQHTRGTLRHSKRKTGNNADIYYLNQPRSAAEARRIAQELMQRDDVEYAEPDYRRYPAFVPNDPRFSTDQWYLKSPPAENGGIKAQEAWDITQGNSSVVIAVIDTGILQHEDIGNLRILSGYDFYSTAAMDNDGDAGTDNDPADPGDAVAANECGPPNHPAENSSWHGTLVSGLLVATTSSLVPQGIAGLDHQALLLPIRALGKCGGLSSDIAEAIRWAAGLPTGDILIPPNPNPADVINLSLGSLDPCTAIEQAAIDAAVAAGAVVVAATGNDGEIGISSPASCDNVIAVAATTREGAETCYTNVGANVDLSAPGGNDSAGACDGIAPSDLILTTGNAGATTAGNDEYSYSMGTSFAAPLVSGTVALMRAVDAGLPPANIEALLKTTVREFPTGTNDGFRDCVAENCGAGILDADGAVTAARDGGVDSVPNPFSFNDRNDMERSTVIVSNRVTITGISTATIKISDRGEYSIDGGPFTDATATINGGQKVKVKLTSSSAHNTEVRTKLTIGGVSDTFTVTTKGGGGGGGGGEAAWLLPLLMAWRLRKSVQ